MTVAGSDNFADAPELPFGASSLVTSTAGKTQEAGEPFPYGGARSVWWKFTAPRTCQVNVDLLQSTYAGSDPFAVQTHVAIFTGSDLASLTLVGGGNYAYDYTNAYTTNLAETDFDATAGTTYYVQATVDASSLDVDLVLRVAESQYVWGSWFQPSNYTVPETTPGDYTDLSGTVIGQNISTSYPKVSDKSANLEDAGRIASAGPFAPGFVPPSGIIEGIFVANDQPFNDPSPYEASYSENASARRIKDTALRVALDPGLNEYHYDYENAATTSTIASVTVRAQLGVGTNGSPDVSATATFGFKDGLNFSDTSSWTAGVSTPIHSMPINLAGEGVVVDVTADATPHLSSDRRGVILTTSYSGFSVTHGLDLNEARAQGGASNVWLDITLTPPLRRWQDKALVGEGTTTRVTTWVRTVQRGDKYAGAPRTVQTNSQQASLRNIGFR